MNLNKLFQNKRIIGVVADVNQGKSMTLYNMIEQLPKNLNIYSYGLRANNDRIQNIYSVAEMEQIKNSVIIIDELSSLFDLDNRKIKKQIENTLRLIYHNNNLLILCGTPENFKKFISAKIEAFIFKKTTIADTINGSRVKNIINQYKGYEKGTEILNLNINECLIYNGLHYYKEQVEYLKKYDTKKDNVPFFVSKNVVKKSNKKKVVNNE